MVIGIPLYDKEGCANYLVKILQAQGFKIIFFRLQNICGFTFSSTLIDEIVEYSDFENNNIDIN